MKNSKHQIVIKQEVDGRLQTKFILLSQHLRIKDMFMISKDEKTSIDFQYCTKNRTYKHQNIISLGREENKELEGDWIHLKDESISRKHCIIVYKEDQMYPKLSQRLQIFMDWCAPRLPSKNCIKVTIPKLIGKMILEYAVQRHGYFIQDIKSTFGTNIKIQKPEKIYQQDFFILGENVMMVVEDLLQIQYLNDHSKLNDIKQKLRRYQSEAQVYIINPKSIQTTRSILIFLISVQKEKNKHFIVYDREGIFHMGVHQEISIEGASNIDYYNPQTSIYFQKGCWWIVDGNGICSSPLGTYKKLINNENYRLSNGTTIKLGLRTKLKFDIQPFD